MKIISEEEEKKNKHTKPTTSKPNDTNAITHYLPQVD